MKKISYIIILSLFLFSICTFSTINVKGDNFPPAISNPNPINNSINNVVNINWTCSINNLDGVLFNYTIQVSQGSSSLVINASNGTKYLVLPVLDYNTKYTVWVNTSDYNSTVFNRSIYYFTTKTYPTSMSYDITIHLIVSIAIIVFMFVFVWRMYYLAFVSDKNYIKRMIEAIILMSIITVLIICLWYMFTS